MDAQALTVHEILVTEAKNAPFLVTSATVVERSNSICVDIHTQNNLFACNGPGRKTLESRTGYRYYPAGGGLYILHLRDQSIALTRYRDAGAPSFPDMLTLGSGLGKEIADIADPRRVTFREMAEEFIVATPDGILMPDPTSNQLMAQAAFSSLRLIDQISGLPPIFSKKILVVSPYWIETSALRNTIIKIDGETVLSFSTIVDLANPYGMDFLEIVEWDLSKYSLKDIAVLDGETKGAKDDVPLNGEVHCLPVKDGRILSTQPVAVFCSGRPQAVPKRTFDVTPPLKAVLEALEG